MSDEEKKPEETEEKPKLPKKEPKLELYKGESLKLVDKGNEEVLKLLEKEGWKKKGSK